MKTPLGTEVDLGAGHTVLDGFLALRERGTAPPLLGPCLLWPRSPISATAELLFLSVPDIGRLKFRRGESVAGCTVVGSVSVG